ncbi:MAG: hypothetical protein EOO22_24425 [Comamonadaceae bacterium]|nr:MAG: hypothetical protein EOO22_24425 [Comamonadaceae bacterium]
MKLAMTAGGAVIATVTLDDNVSAIDLAALLPLDLVLDDYEATEKIATLPRALSVDGAPAGYAPSAGDVSFCAPWGNLAIFHKDFAYSDGLVRLGRLDSGVDAMRRPGSLRVRVQRVTS